CCRTTPRTSPGRSSTSTPATTLWGCDNTKEPGADAAFLPFDPYEPRNIDRHQAPAWRPVHRDIWMQHRRRELEPDPAARVHPERRMGLAHVAAAARIAIPALTEVLHGRVRRLQDRR